MIHITDSQTDRILDFIPEDEFWDDKHYKSLKDTLETFDFVTFADREFSEHLAKRNRIIIPDEDGKYVEFVIENTRKYRDSNGGLYIEVYTSASYIDLAKAKVIKPQTLANQTVSTAVSHAIGGTEWEAGTIANVGTRTFVIEEHTNPYSFLKRIASEFDLELHFRVEVDGNKVVRRYVDLVERVGMWRGREVEFGKDLIGIERKEDFSNIVTALIGLGPEREDGSRIEVFVEDKDALARWGRNGQHIIDVYEPQSTDQTMTEARLRELTQNELEKRINSIVEYTADIADLEKVPGLEHEKIRFGDTIKIKDTGFEPPLYLEARVHTQERSIKKNGYKKVTLGDYIEYTEEEVMAIWKSLKAEIAKKVSLSDVMEVTYTKTEIDDKDAGVYQDSTQYSDVISETKKQEAIQVAAVDATEKANQAKQEAVEQAESIAEQKKQLAIQAAIADADAKLNAAKTELEADIALKADAEWVNGQLQLKENAIHRGATAPTDTTKLWLDTSVVPNVLKRYDSATSSWVKATPTSAGEVGAYTKTEVDNALNSKVSVTQYTTDMNGVITRLDSAESRITQNENEIATKVSNTTYQQDKAALESDISALETRMSNAETSITQNANQIELKANKTDVYTKSQIDGQFNTVNQQISQLNAELSVQAEQIATKVSQTTFDSQMATKANASDVYTKSEVDSKLANGDIYLRGTGLNRKGARILKVNGNTIYNTASGRGLRLVTIKRSDLSIVEDITYDVYGSDQARTELANKLNSLDDSVIVTLTSYDAIATNDALDAAIKRCGGTGRRFGGSFHRVPYALVGIPGIGESSGIEIYTSTDSNAPMAEIYTKVINGTPQGINTIGQNLGTRLSTAETSITQLANQIQLKANQTTVDTLANRISSAESSINLLSDEIDLKVNKDGVISAINVSPEGVRIDGAKVHITGQTTIDNGVIKTAMIADAAITNAKIASLSADKITTGAIRGIDIYGSQFLSSDGNTRLSIIGGDVRLTQNNGNYVNVNPTGLFGYNSSNSMTFRVDKTLVTSSALGTTVENVYLGAYGEARVVNYDDIPGDGRVGSYRYLPLRADGFYGNYLDVTTGVNLYIRPYSNGEVRVTNVGSTTSYRPLRASNYFGDSLDVNVGPNVYIRPFSNGEVRITNTGSTTSYRPLRASNLFGDSVAVNNSADGTNLYIQSAWGGEVRATAIGSTTSYVPLRAANLYAASLDTNTGGSVYVRPSSKGSVHITVTGTTNKYRPIYASEYRNGSSIEYKTNITELQRPAMDIIRGLHVVEYDLKSDIENGEYNNRQIGLISEENPEVASPDGKAINIYKLTSLNTAGIQELDSEQMKMKDEIEWLKLENQYLKQKIQQLEAMVS